MGFIYKISCLKTDKVYIGQTKFLLKRIRGHFRSLIKNKHTNFLLQKDWNLYGPENFEWYVLYDSIPEKFLSHLEIIQIEQNNSFKNGYNLTIGGENLFLNKKHSEYTLSLLSLQKIGNKNPMYGLTSSLNPFYGSTHTNEFKEYIGKVTSEANSGQNNPMSNFSISKRYNISLEEAKILRKKLLRKT